MVRFNSTLKTGALLLLIPLGGCLAAAAGAGAAAAIIYDERNASADVSASVNALHQSTLAVFGEMGIEMESHEMSESGTEMDIQGRAGDGTDVAVNIENEGGATTKVVVTAREGTLDYKPTYAGQILERIIERAT